MVKAESILKWNVEGSLLKKLKVIRAQILSKNSDAIAIEDKDLHVTLAGGPGWNKMNPRYNSLLPQLLNITLGIVTIQGFLFGVGKIIFGELLFGVSVICLAILSVTMLIKRI